VKNRPNCSPYQVLPKLIHSFVSEKNWATSVTKKLPKEHNIPIGENSPNLVTLLEKSFFPRIVYILVSQSKSFFKQSFVVVDTAGIRQYWFSKVINVLRRDAESQFVVHVKKY
jgi:hypothetical protein